MDDFIALVAGGPAAAPRAIKTPANETVAPAPTVVTGATSKPGIPRRPLTRGDLRDRLHYWNGPTRYEDEEPWPGERPEGIWGYRGGSDRPTISIVGAGPKPERNLRHWLVSVLGHPATYVPSTDCWTVSDVYLSSERRRPWPPGVTMLADRASGWSYLRVDPGASPGVEIIRRPTSLVDQLYDFSKWPLADDDWQLSPGRVGTRPDWTIDEVDADGVVRASVGGVGVDWDIKFGGYALRSDGSAAQDRPPALDAVWEAWSAGDLAATPDTRGGDIGFREGIRLWSTRRLLAADADDGVTTWRRTLGDVEAVTRARWEMTESDVLEGYGLVQERRAAERLRWAAERAEEVRLADLARPKRRWPHEWKPPAPSGLPPDPDELF